MKRKFFLKNFIAGSLPALVVAVLLGGRAVWMNFREARAEVNRIQERTLLQLKDNMNVMFSDADAQCLNYSAYPYIMAQLRELLNAGYQDMRHVEINNMLKPFLDSFVNTKPYLHSVYLYLDNQGGNFFASGVGVANELNHRDTLWIEEIKEQEDERKQWIESRITSAYQKSSYDERVLTLYKKIYYSGRRNPAGTLLMNIRTEYLEQLMESSLAFEGQSMVVAAGENVLIQAGENVNYFDLSAKEKEGFFIEEKEIPGYDIVLISLVPARVVYSQAAGLISLLWVAIFLSLLLGMYTAFLTARRNAGNVQRVINIFEAAENGEKLPEVSKRVNDEYSYIIQNVVKSFLEKNYLKMQLEEKKYKLDSMYFSFLQSQINPHFLFNTLKNIFWKTVRMTGGQNDASRMIDLLTTLLHYALVHPARFVTIGEEVKMTECYLEIQRLRFGPDICINWDYDSAVGEEEIIRFVLQPLVENSLSHGMEHHRGGILTISISRKEGRICFCVSDNGAGFTPERLDETRARLTSETAPVEGIGLYNLNRRLILTYGGEAGLEIESEPFKETKICFQIPVKKS